MPRAIWTFVLLVLCCSLARAQTTAPATTRAVLDDDQLLRLASTELGDLFKPDDAAKYLAAQALIETYFATTSFKERTEIAKQLTAGGLDANLIGRLIRIRRGWQDLSPGVYWINELHGPHEVKYFLGLPQTYHLTTASPLVIVLPTADAFLTNPPPDNLAVTDIYKQWMAEEVARHGDAIVLMPLLNLDELYGPSRLGMNSVIQPMHHAAEIANIDPKRVYLMGHSLAGHAVWNLALHYPTYFAAVAPLGAAAGADWQRLRLMNLRNTFPVVWHDADDEVIPADAARSIVRAIRGLKLDISYTETKNLGHAMPPQVAKPLVETMRARSRDLYPREVFLQSNKPDTLFNRADWVQIYQPMRPGPEKKLIIGRGTGQMTVYQNAFSVKASIADNKLAAVTENVELMRFFFNDQMVNMNRAVTIAVNGKNRIEGHLKPDIDAMLKDAAFMGRGWRYYSAFLDVDFGPAPTTRPATTPATK